MKYSFILNKAYHEWAEQFITERQLRLAGNLNSEDQLLLKVQGQDEKITATNPVDLARFGIEQIYTLKAEKYQFIINERLLVSHEPFISVIELRSAGKIPPDDDLYLKQEGADRKLTEQERIALQPYPIEEFYSRPSKKLVTITIDNKLYEIKSGKYSVSQLKTIGKVNAAYVLGQLINNILESLAAGAEVVIKGGEEFKSFPKDGSSS